MTTLSRDAILAAGARPVTPVEVPEWGGTVCLRPLSGSEVSDAYADGAASDVITQRLVAMSICDADGKRIFTAADAPALFDKGYAGLKPLISKTLEINRMTSEAVTAARKD